MLPRYTTLLQYSATINRLRGFFLNRNYVETDVIGRVHTGSATQLRLQLDQDFLSNSALNGIFYTNTPPGGSTTLGFQTHGGVEELESLLSDLLTYIGYEFPRDKTKFPNDTYDDICWGRGVNEIDDATKAKLCDPQPVFFVKRKPASIVPELERWNISTHPRTDTDMNRGEYLKTVDVLLSGKTAIAGAELSCDTEALELCHTVVTDSDKLNEYLNHNFIPRSRGEIDTTTVIHSLRGTGLLC